MDYSDFKLLLETKIKKALQAQQIILDQQLNDWCRDVKNREIQFYSGSNSISSCNEDIVVSSWNHNLGDNNDIYDNIKHRCNYYVVQDCHNWVIDLQNISRKSNIFTVLDIEGMSDDILDLFPSNSHNRYTYYYDKQLLIYSESAEDHNSHLAHTFDTLSYFDVDASYTKGQFAQPCVEFNHFLLSRKSFSPCKTSVDIITHWPVPKQLFELVDFVNKIKVFEHVIFDFEFVARALIDIASSYCECDDLSMTITLTPEQVDSFRLLRELFIAKEDDQGWQFGGTGDRTDLINIANLTCSEDGASDRVGNNYILSLNKNWDTKHNLRTLSPASYLCDDAILTVHYHDLKAKIEICGTDYSPNSISNTTLKVIYKYKNNKPIKEIKVKNVNNCSYIKTHPPINFGGKYNYEFNATFILYLNGNSKFNIDLFLKYIIMIYNNLHCYWKLYHPPKRIK